VREKRGGETDREREREREEERERREICLFIEREERREE
jgi:hypothetical protein